MESHEMEEIKRYFGVIAEGLRGDIRQVAEGHEVIRHEVHLLRNENDLAHKEILSAIKFSYAELDRRITAIEVDFNSLKQRVENLEMKR